MLNKNQGREVGEEGRGSGGGGRGEEEGEGREREGGGQSPFVSTVAGKIGLSNKKATKLDSTRSSTLNENPP
jgi:hypothetical protein